MTTNEISNEENMCSTPVHVNLSNNSGGQDEMDVSSLERKAIPELLGKNFFIPDYQRGYRWEKKQVLQLIEDIHKFFGSSNNAAFYCLQSIVVKKCSLETIKKYNLSSNLDNNTWYEVIDGQQRLTTLRVFLAFYFATSFLDDRPPYKLAYATRPLLGSLFDGLELDLKNRRMTF